VVPLPIILPISPSSSSEQLRAVRRVAAPPLGDRAPIDGDTDRVLGVRKEARGRRVGYQTLINDVLTGVWQNVEVLA
jgi:hypothetical protein